MSRTTHASRGAACRAVRQPKDGLGVRPHARHRWLVASGLAVAMLAMGGVAVTSTVSGAAPVKKTTVVLAESAGAPPNYIFPYETVAYFDGPNTGPFQTLMYRPLYWFGKGDTATLDPTLSLADTPVETNGGKTFTITLKTYKWSNGTAVTTTNVMFWLNIWHQKPTGYGGWFPGGLSMPTSIQSVKVTSPTKITINFDRSFNSHWLLYNELSQIRPLPTAWTRTSLTAKPGSAGCATAAYGTDDSACHAVYVFLSEQSGFNPTKPKTTIDALPTYATNPIWQVVDGPWKLKSFGPTQPVIFVANPAYSGPNKPTYKEFIERPFTTESAEYNALVAGTVDLGILPFTEVTSPGKSPTSPSKTVQAGKNNARLATYNLVPMYRWNINYLDLNYNSTGGTGNAGPIFRQLYFRQAMQSLVDQPLYINRLEKGYAVPTYGPVPVWPHNPFASKFEEADPYPFRPSKSKALLSSHGWKVTPGGTDVCERAGTSANECGKGVKKGAKLSFTLQFGSGTKTVAQLMAAEKASWSSVGINVTLSSGSIVSIYGTDVPCPKGCGWEMVAGGWGYWPDVYPTGEEIFATGAGSNTGSFNTPTNNANIKETDTTNVSLTKYENHLAKELPGIWQPMLVTTWEFRKGLDHPKLAPIGDGFTPATLHWS